MRTLKWTSSNVVNKLSWEPTLNYTKLQITFTDTISSLFSAKAKTAAVSNGHGDRDMMVMVGNYGDVVLTNDECEPS